MIDPVPWQELEYNPELIFQLSQLWDQIDPEIASRAQQMLDAHPRFTPYTPELSEAMRRVFESALDSGLIAYPQPEEPPPLPEPRYVPGLGEAPLHLGWDKFPIYAGDPLREAHERVDECLVAVGEASNPRAVDGQSEPIRVILESRGERRGSMLCAVVRRRAWHYWQDEALAAQLLYKTRYGFRIAADALGQLWDPLFEEHTLLTPDQLTDVVCHRNRLSEDDEAFYAWDDGVLARLAQQTIDAHGRPEALMQVLARWAECVERDQSRWGTDALDKADRLVRDIQKLLGTAPKIPLKRGEAWADAAIEQLTALSATDQAAWVELLEHAGTADGGKPKAKWSKTAAPLVEAVGIEKLLGYCGEWFELSHQPRTRPLPPPRVLMDYDPNLLLDSVNARVLKGLAWCLGIVQVSESASSLRELALSGLKAVPGRGPRDTKLSNAAVWALSQLPGTDGVAQLSVLKTKVKHKPTLKGISKAFDEASEREGVQRHEIEEVAVPIFGLTDVGIRREVLGDFTAELVVTGSTTELRWLRADGKPQKSVPKAVKDDHAGALKELKSAAKDLQKLLPAQRDRLDQLHLKQQSWPYSVWAERYLNHRLLGTLARRLIWCFTNGDDVTEAVWLNGKLVDPAGQPVEIATETAVLSLWHPIGKQEANIQAWRTFFEDRQIKQPFKQAHREVYLLTDAERNTGVYSNRFAAHIIKQHQFNALCAVRGWQNQLRLLVDAEYEPATLEIPAWSLRAEFWVEGAGDEYGEDTNDVGTFHYLATDQVRFYRMGAARNSAWTFGEPYRMGSAGPGEDGINEPIPVAEIPPLVFSEVMRDVDLFVGVASVGNDPQWEDGGRANRYGHDGYWASYSFGDLSGTATTRKQMLERLVPRLKIADRCSFDEKFLVVRGDVRTYKIHLGSGNILMEPNDQYLCIVPGRGGAGRGAVKGEAGKVFFAV